MPVIMQMEALECGAASLAMILAYYGKWIPLEQARSDCGVSRDGSNAKNILLAARSYGLDAAGYRYEVEQLKEFATFPCIIHWEFDHFLVLDGFKGDKAYLNDPARGSYSIPMEVFDEGFTGVCLQFEPTEAFEPGGKQRSVLSFAKKRLVGTGPAIAFVILTTIISSLIDIMDTGMSRIFLDYLLPGKNPNWLMPFIMAMGGLAILQVAVSWVQAIYSLKINGKMAVVSGSSYMWKVLRLPMEFFTQRMAGDIQARQATNESIADALVGTLAPLFLETVMMVFYFVVMIRFSPVLTAIGLISVLADFGVSRFVSAKRVNVTRVLMRDEGKLSGMTVSGIEMIETIKSAGAENGFFEKWSGYQASVNTQNIRYAKINQYLGLIPSTISTITDITILFCGVFLCMRGHFTLGMVMAFQTFLASFLAPAGSLISAGQMIQEMRTNMERIEDVMEYPVAIEDKGNEFDEDTEYDKLSGNLSMRHVTFGYSKLAPPLVKDFNLELKRGSSVAFVGPSGCGKSTLSKLISGLYTQWDGEILFDGKAISEIDRSIFTGSVAVVDQDIILFEDTISNNIRMWDTSIEDFEVILASRDANLHDDIMQRDGGYQYKVLEGGKDFSGGQRQRMEIARVLAQDPTLIILDEATSALDAQTEFEVVKAIRNRGITCIVIAHRLSTIRDCDEILVMDHGDVVERGTHDELIKLNGKYTELVTSE